MEKKQNRINDRKIVKNDFRDKIRGIKARREYNVTR